METYFFYTVFVLSDSSKEKAIMNIDQLNEFINRGGAALALTLIAFFLIFIVFRKNTESSRKRAR